MQPSTAAAAGPTRGARAGESSPTGAITLHSPLKSPTAAAAPAVERPTLEADEPEEPAPVPDDTKADPFGDDAFGEGEPAERKASELEDGLDQRDEQAEREAAAGEGGMVLEKIE